jgi:hypothetical protein
MVCVASPHFCLFISSIFVSHLGSEYQTWTFVINQNKLSIYSSDISLNSSDWFQILGKSKYQEYRNNRNIINRYQGLD